MFMNEHMESFQKNQTWDLVELLAPGPSIGHGKWVCGLELLPPSSSLIPEHGYQRIMDYFEECN